MNSCPSDLDYFIGQKIRTYRKKQKWPLKTLAQKLNISLQQLQRYEKGLSKISVSTLYEIASIINISFHSFLEGWKEKTSKEITQKHEYSILLIESNPQEEFLLREIFEKFPKDLSTYVLHTSDHVRSFLKKNETEDRIYPDLIFFDLNISDEESFSLIHTIKQNSFFKNKPLLILTSSTDSRTWGKLSNVPSSGVIYKSPIYEDFEKQVWQALTYWTEAFLLPCIT